MKRSTRMMCVLIGTVLCLPRTVTAQSSELAIDFVLGAASTHGGEFGERGAPAVGIAVAHGTGVAHATIIGVSVDVIGAPRGDKCFIRSDGRCLGPFPNMMAVGVEIGRNVPLVSRMHAELFGVLGVSWFYLQPAMRAPLVGGGVRVVGPLTSHLALVASIRGLVSPNTPAGTLWVAPVTVGVRLH